MIDYHAILRIDYLNKAVTLITGEKLSGETVDGSLADSRFSYPRNLQFIGNGTFLVADTWADIMRIVDMNENNVSTINICSGCITLRAPYSLLMTNDSLYIGESGQILRFPCE